MMAKSVCILLLLELPAFPVAFLFREDGNWFMITLLLWQFFIVGLLLFVTELSDERIKKSQQGYVPVIETGPIIEIPEEAG
jgi:hypothetical protein